jgi:hypothetical protein
MSYCDTKDLKLVVKKGKAWYKDEFYRNIKSYYIRYC